jgi:predicted O-methyltransferase YrrM
MKMKQSWQRITRKFCIATWEFWERLGVHVSPNHFYWPLPDTRKLREYDFSRKFSLSGIAIDDAACLRLLDEISSYMDEYADIHEESGYASNGDGAILYGMMRVLKPRRVVEIGSGSSTKITLLATRRNKFETGIETRITAVEPYPRDDLRELVSSASEIEMLVMPVEKAHNEFIQTLNDGDVLFIDSSHVIATGNDVHYLYLDVLPNLPVGVVVHIHDIRFPMDYPREWVIDARKIWSEQYLLHMFLAFNQHYEIIFPSNYLYDRYPEKMSSKLIGLAEKGSGWPGSFWIRRIK